ncbi:MAG: DUF3127 domain-containing protein [Chitinophagaceae bacterium]|nr:DUF3127 domain-containing protein [Chitinophagaceae bacterium]
MQLTAKLTQVLPLQTGAGRNGEWKKQDIIVETEGQYPKKICISIWGDKINSAQLQPGAMLNISFDVESREYNGRWYTDVKAWRIEPAGAAGAQPQPDNNDDFTNQTFTSSDDDLPF